MNGVQTLRPNYNDWLRHVLVHRVHLSCAPFGQHRLNSHELFDTQASSSREQWKVLSTCTNPNLLTTKRRTLSGVIWAVREQWPRLSTFAIEGPSWTPISKSYYCSNHQHFRQVQTIRLFSLPWVIP